MIADEPRSTPGIGKPDATVLDSDAFHRAIVAFIERELPVWRDRPNTRQFSDEPTLNQTLCLHLNSAARRDCFDTVQFNHESLQIAGRHADIGVHPVGTIIVEGRSYEDYEQLLPIECKRLPTPRDSKRSDCEYVHGLHGHRTGAIERFKHCLHGPANDRAMIIAYVQSENFIHWLNTINKRLTEMDTGHIDDGLWRPIEQLQVINNDSTVLCKLGSKHRRSNSRPNNHIDIEHVWLAMN